MIENNSFVSIPLDAKQMKSFFENKDKQFWVDYSSSDLKENVFLTYISNLDLKAELVFDKSSSVEKKKLLLCFMKSRHIVSSRTLSLACLQVLLFYKGANFEEFDIPTIFTEEEVDDFVKENTDLVHSWCSFLDSMILYVSTCFEGLEKAVGIDDNYEQVDDNNFIGLNVVTLFSIEGFFEVYYSLPLGEMKNYIRQFEEYMFNGKNLFHYFNSENNYLLQLFSGLINKEISFNQLELASS